MDGVHHSTERRNDGRLANPDHSFTFIFVVNQRNEFRDFKRAGQLIITKSRVELKAKLRVHHAAFPESHAERLKHPAVDLAFDGETIERQPNVLHLHHLDWTHVPRLDINFDLSEARAMNAVPSEV